MYYTGIVVDQLPTPIQVISWCHFEITHSSYKIWNVDPSNILTGVSSHAWNFRSAPFFLQYDGAEPELEVKTEIDILH